MSSGSTKKTKELMMRMKMMNIASDLQGSACLLMSVIPFSWPFFEDASSNSSVGHVRNPKRRPAQAAPRCVLQQEWQVSYMISFYTNYIIQIFWTVNSSIKYFRNGEWFSTGWEIIGPWCIRACPCSINWAVCMNKRIELIGLTVDKYAPKVL